MHRDAFLAALHQHADDKTIRIILDGLYTKPDCAFESPSDVFTSLLPQRTSVMLSQIALDLTILERMEALLRKENIKVITLKDEGYPMALLALPVPPPLLYVKGKIDILRNPCIGICGSRKASAKGLSFARQFGATVAKLEMCEVSGYAQGVDTEAHLGALEAGANTIVVLAEGIFNFRLKKPFRSIPSVLDQMTVISEFHPSKPWHVSNAMKRNKTICGLSKGLVVVEAQASGGTLAAGKECLAQKKPLFVIEYSDSTKMPLGNSQLISDGGIPLRSYKELHKALNRIKIAPSEFTNKTGQLSLNLSR